MVNVDYDAEHNAVLIAFEGEIDAAQAVRSFSVLEQVLPKGRGGFKVLADFSSVDAMEPEVEGVIVKAMEFLNAQGVAEVVRVLPDPDLDIGFDIMSRAHYSKRVRIQTVRSREEALARL
ncbi:MAG: hypothetical protein ACHQ49_11465 [Elusimicrobiota bacterium]